MKVARMADQVLVVTHARRSGVRSRFLGSL
jgi:hypothetical protein